jgi:elongation factor G
MPQFETIRNVGVIAHIDAGKTTMTEGMLYYSGRTHRIGSIDDGTTVMDYMPEERERGITIVAAAGSFEWNGHLIHLIDTPGHIDFTAEVERSLRVEGVEAQSEKVWHQAETYHVPRVAFINKMDRLGASFTRVYEEINAKFGGAGIAVQMPIGQEDRFEGIVDLVRMQRIRFAGEANEQVIRDPVPEDVRGEAEVMREEMIERLADLSDEIAVLYLEGDPIPVEAVQSALRRATCSGRVVPVFVGSAKMRSGVQPLMDAVVDYLPSPDDVGRVMGHEVKSGDEVWLEPDPAAPFAGLVFKVVAGTSADLLYVRTYSGTLRSGATLVNARTGNKVRVKQLLRLYAKSTEAVESVGPGDIVGVIGPRDCGTGDTICDPRRHILLEKILFPEPVISVAVEPKSTREKDRLDETLALLCREDPTLSLGVDEDTGQRLFGGMGELHLEVSLGRLAREFSVEAKVGEPRVAYRETFTAGTVEKAVFERVIGETELFAGVEIAFEPLPRGEDVFRIENRMGKRKDIPRAFLEQAETTLHDGLHTGGSHGYPLIYVSACIRHLEIHPEYTTEGAVAGAVLQAIDQAIRKVGTVILEPLMRLEILAPAGCVGDITMYLQPRRALIHEMTAMDQVTRVSCEVPLAEMFGFGKSLPKLSGGRASFSMMPCGYQKLAESQTNGFQ